MRRLLLVISVGLALLWQPGNLLAQQLTRDVTASCVRAAVKVISLGPNNQGSTGSGSMIDSRGYVLTNFHVVGHTEPGVAAPGTLINPDNIIYLATVDSARESARPRFIGMVVRADVYLDLALVRIVSDMDGNPLQDASFPTVEMAPTTDLLPGSQLWAFGFPLGVRTINVTGGALTGFQMNTQNDVSWLRSDAEFNPGNSGGMLVDAEGRLVGVPTAVYHGERTLEPIELARPVERIPSEWLESLRTGDIDDVIIDGPVELPVGDAIADHAVGDGSSFGSSEPRYYRVPSQRPGRITLSENLEVLAGATTGAVLRSGYRTLEIEATDPEDVVVLVAVPGNLDTTMHFAIRYELRQDPANVVPLVASNSEEAETPPGPKDLTTSPARDEVAVSGFMVDAMTGRPVAGMVVIGLPGTDLQRNLEDLLAGRMSDEAFDQTVVGGVSTDVSGWYSFTEVPRGAVYPFAGISADYNPVFFDLTIADDAPALHELNPLQMMR